jgi:hypothetical protein
LVRGGLSQQCAQLQAIDNKNAAVVVIIASAQDRQQQWAKVGIHAMYGLSGVSGWWFAQPPHTT